MELKKHSKSLWTTWSILILMLSLFIVFPLVNLLFKIDVRDFGNFIANDTWKRASLNTVIVCLCSTTLSVFTGCVFAYAVVRGNIPFKKFFSFIPVIHLITPPFVSGLSFMFLFGKQGFFTHTILGLNVDPYGLPGLLISQTLCFFPLAYLIYAQALKGINPNVEMAAKSMGASDSKIFWTVILPMSLPGIITSFLFIAVNVLSDFGNPLIVGGRFRVLAVEIYTQLTGWIGIGKSAVLGIALVVPSVILFVVHNLYVKKTGEKYSSIGGKSLFDESEEKEKGFSAHKIILTAFVFFITFIIIAQLVSIVMGSIQKIWGVNSQITFEHLKKVADHGRVLWNTLYYAFVSSVISVIIACCSAYIVQRTSLPLRKTIDSLVQLPSAIPGSLLGLCLGSAAIVLHFKWASFMIIVAMTTGFLPFAYKMVTQKFSQIKSVLDDSSRSLGANQITTLRKILVPLSYSGIFSGFVYDFIRGTGTLSAVIFLVSFDTPLTSIKIVNLASECFWGEAAALALVLTVITFAILGTGLALWKFFSLKR